jgi:hypothetical protein
MEMASAPPFTISVSTVSKIGATCIEYKGTHRAVHKVNEEKSTTVIDSSAKRVLKLQVGEKSKINLDHLAGKTMIVDKYRVSR